MSREHLLKVIAPLVERVRADHHAMKGANGTVCLKEPLTRAHLLKHLDGGPPRGTYVIKPGESTTRVALLDLDSHKGQTPWAEMVVYADVLCDEAAKRGLRPTVFRSTGGHGIHIYAIWDEPQDAYSVRCLMRDVLAAAGFTDGTGGVSRNEVEVFPKQDAVAEGRWGNMFVLPLAGKSRLMEPLLGWDVLEDLDDAAGAVWEPSDPVPSAVKPALPERSVGSVLKTPEALRELRSALAAIPNDGEGLPYHEWRDIIFGVHQGTGGSEEGYELAYEFSARSFKFSDTAELDEKVWGPSDANREGGITVATVFKAARDAGWQDVTPEDFAVVEAAEDEAPAGPPVLDPKDVMLLARAYLRAKHTKAGRVSLLRSSGLWYEHVGTHWDEVADDEVRHGVWLFLEGARKEVLHKGKDDAGKSKTWTSIEPFCPTMAQVTSAVDALKAAAAIKSAAPPTWLPGHTGPDAREVVSLSDGLLHIPTRELLPHSPGFFSVNTLPFPWNGGGRPAEWLKFLDAVWPGDRQAQDALQEMFGYLLTADTSQQKMFLLRGPKRSGKGTIARVLGALLGRENMVSPTLTSLTSNFGLQPLIGKLVAMIPDARVGGQTNTQAVVEKLLMLSGEDSITVDRKNKDAWTGTLAARVVIMTNEVPQLGDASGALAGRFIVISMSQSFYGREDLGLTGRLLKELPAIFRWALDGRDRLKGRGYFVQPASAAEDADELAEANSPITVFADEVLEFGQDYSAPIADVFSAWQSWCGQNGRTHSGTSQTFSKSLRAAFPEVKKWRPRDGETRAREFSLIRIKPHVRSELGLFS